MQQIEKLIHGETSILGMEGDWVKLRECLVASHCGFLGPHHALYWDLATRGAVKYAPQGQIVGSVLELMLGPRSHEQNVA